MSLVAELVKSFVFRSESNNSESLNDFRYPKGTPFGSGSLELLQQRLTEKLADLR